MKHYEGYELEYKFSKIWDKLRYQKIDDIFQSTQEIINILENHIEDKLLFINDVNKIQHIFTKMKRKNYFYMSGDIEKAVKLIDPKFNNLFQNRKCIRKLRYLPLDDNTDIELDLERGKVYTSSKFNGAIYTIKNNGKKYKIGHLHFIRIT